MTLTRQGCDGTAGDCACQCACHREITWSLRLSIRRTEITAPQSLKPIYDTILIKDQRSRDCRRSVFETCAFVFGGRLLTPKGASESEELEPRGGGEE